MVLTVKGQAAAVVQDAEAYQRLLDVAAKADAREGIRQGLEEARSGKGRPVRAFFAEFKAKRGLPVTPGHIYFGNQSAAMPADD